MYLVQMKTAILFSLRHQISYHELPTIMALSRDTCNFLQDGLEKHAIYSFERFLSKIDLKERLWSIFRHKDRSFYIVFRDIIHTTQYALTIF